MNPSTLQHPLTRRNMLKQAAIGGVALAGANFNTLQADDRPSGHLLRVIAYNVYNCTGWPKDRALAKKSTAQGQMVERFAQELELYDPDIINFSESPSEAMARQIATRLGMNHVRFPSGGNWPGTLLSRFEIIDSTNAPVVDGKRSDDLFTRHWGRATVRLPNGEPLIVHSAHLRPPPATDIRVREIREMLKSMRDDLRAERSMILLGDLNHAPTPPEYPMWTDAGWIDTFTKVGKGKGLTIKADRPDLRIDYVLAAGGIANKVIESRPLFEGAFRTNTADPNSFALSDHLPQLAVFQLGE